jgi:hypothetical protein
MIQISNGSGRPNCKPPNIINELPNELQEYVGIPELMCGGRPQVKTDGYT